MPTSCDKDFVQNVVATKIEAFFFKNWSKALIQGLQTTARWDCFVHILYLRNKGSLLLSYQKAAIYMDVMFLLN